MSEHIYKQIELTGSSTTSVEDAVQNAITKAGKTLHNIHWFQVVETRGYIENNKIDYWQVTISWGFVWTIDYRGARSRRDYHKSRLPSGLRAFSACCQSI
jgi:hypothetical protein